MVAVFVSVVSTVVSETICGHTGVSSICQLASLHYFAPLLRIIHFSCQAYVFFFIRSPFRCSFPVNSKLLTALLP